MSSPTFDVPAELKAWHKVNGKFNDVADMLNWFTTLAKTYNFPETMVETYVTQYAAAWVTGYRGNMGFVQKLQGRQSHLTRSQLKGVLNCIRFDPNGAIHLQPKQDGQVPAKPAQPKMHDFPGGSITPLSQWAEGAPLSVVGVRNQFRKFGRTGKVTTGYTSVDNGVDLFFTQTTNGKWADHIFVVYRLVSDRNPYATIKDDDPFGMAKVGLQRPGEVFKYRDGLPQPVLDALLSVPCSSPSAVQLVKTVAHSTPTVKQPANMQSIVADALGQAERSAEEPAPPAVTPLVDTVRREAPAPAAKTAARLSPEEMRAAIAARKSTRT